MPDRPGQTLYPEEVTSPSSVRAVARAEGVPPAPDRVAAARARRLVRAVGPALATVVAAYALLASGALPASAALVLAAGLLVAVPTAPDLSRRIAVNGAAFLGWVCTTWWVRWPVPVDHAAVVVALTSGGLLAWVLVGRRPRDRVHALRPAVGRTDLLPLVGGALALATMWRWAFPASPRAALAALLPGIDSVAHFHMFSTVRAYGATLPALGPAPDGSPWPFDTYPQGFHAVAATVSELLHPRLTPGPATVVAYTESVSVVVVAAVVVLTAAVLSVESLRQRPLVALPALVCTWGAFLWRPGQDVLADGFGNFWLAAAAAGTAMVLSLTPSRRLALPDLVAVAGLLVLVANAWAPLAVIAAPAILALWWPVLPTLRDPALRRRLGWTAVVLVAAGLAALTAFSMLVTSVAVGTLVGAFGGIHGTSPLPAFVLLVVGLYSCLAGPSLTTGRHAVDATGTAARARWLLAGPVAGLALGAALLVGQLQTLGTSSYYFVKYFMGFELVLAAFVPTVAAFLVASLTRPVRGPGRAAVALLATGLATQAFGSFPGRSMPLLDGSREGTASMRPPYSAMAAAAGIVEAAASTPGREGFERDYLAIGRDGALQAFYPDAWYHAVSGTLSGRASARFDVLRRHVDTVEQAVPLARGLLRGDPRLELLVPARSAAALRAGLEEPDLARRVLSVQTEGER